jgi:hypothetical protein
MKALYYKYILRILFLVSLTLLLLAFIIYVLSSRIDIQAPSNKLLSLNDYPLLSLMRDTYNVTESDMKFRSIAVAKGSLWKTTNIKVELLLTKNGMVKQSCSINMGTSSARLDSFIWYHINSSLGLCDIYTSNGIITILCGRAPSIVGSVEVGPHNIFKNFIKHNLCTIRLFKKEIIYVEGDRDPIVHPGMSIEQFLKDNNGEYLVVLVSLC